MPAQPALPQRQLGPLTVSAEGFGCMGISEFYGPGLAPEAGERLIQQALDRGVTLLDTADMYGSGHNEMLVGRAIRGRREQVVIATKFGNMRGIDGSHLGTNGRPEYVQAACEMSLRRLDIETIDLYYQHRVDPQVPIEETVGAMAELVRQGKVRYLGLSEAGAATIRRAHRTHPIAALQTEYSLWSREPEHELFPLCRELGLGFVAYSPLGRGFLTGAIRETARLAANDWRRTGPRFVGDNLKANLGLLDRVEAMARQKGCTPAQLALAWVLAPRPDAPVIVPIPGTRRLPYLEQNLGALQVALSERERQEIEAALPQAAGERYVPAGMAKVNL